MGDCTSGQNKKYILGNAYTKRELSRGSWKAETVVKERQATAESVRERETVEEKMKLECSGRPLPESITTCETKLCGS